MSMADTWPHFYSFLTNYHFQICATMKPTTPDEVERLLKLCLEWMLFSDSVVCIKLGSAQFRSLSEKNLSTFSSVVNANFMIDIFTNAVHVNKREIPVLVSIIFVLFELKDPEIDRSLVNVTKSHVFKFFKDQVRLVWLGVNFVMMAPNDWC